LALLCSREAIVTRVLHDSLQLSDPLTPGTLLSSIVEPASLPRWRHFLRNISPNPGIRGCPLNVVVRGKTTRLWITASERSGTLEIAGGSTPALAAKIRQRFLGHFEAPPAARTADARERFLARNIELENAGEEKTRWILAAAHDLRNQLHALQAYTELLTEDNCLQPEQKKMIESIHDSTDFMMHLLLDLEEIAWADSGAHTLRLAPTDLVSLLHECVSLSRPAAEHKSISVDLNCLGPVPEMNVDPQKIRQVIGNLLGNAIKHPPEGAKVKVDIFPDGACVHISVCDDGPGIPADELNIIFTPFQKTRSRAASHDPGTGLGLAISKRIVEQHGGRIWAESKLGEGATFHVELPRIEIARTHRTNRMALCL